MKNAFGSCRQQGITMIARACDVFASVPRERIIDCDHDILVRGHETHHKTKQGETEALHLPDRLPKETMEARVVLGANGSTCTQNPSHCVPPQTQQPAGDDVPKRLEGWGCEAASEKV
jgi:hypothetical protein